MPYRMTRPEALKRLCARALLDAPERLTLREVAAIVGMSPSVVRKAVTKTVQEWALVAIDAPPGKPQPGTPRRQTPGPARGRARPGSRDRAVLVDPPNGDVVFDEVVPAELPEVVAFDEPVVDDLPDLTGMRDPRAGNASRDKAARTQGEKRGNGKTKGKSKAKAGRKR